MFTTEPSGCTVEYVTAVPVALVGGRLVTESLSVLLNCSQKTGAGNEAGGGLGGGGLATAARKLSLEVDVSVLELAFHGTHSAPLMLLTSNRKEKGLTHGPTRLAAPATSAAAGDVPDLPATPTPGAYTERHEKL